ncbi:MAG: NADH-ubiquinone oxidoreductase-F iron-sulfur binding region domain-containing protein [Candidatus Sumerlaeia bacterium]
MKNEATLIALKDLAGEYRKRTDKLARRIVICAGTGCVASGALKVRDALVAAIEKEGLPVTVALQYEASAEEADPGILVSKSGCQGFCQMGPLMTIEPEGFFFVKVKPEDATEIVETTLKGGQVVERLLYKEPGREATCPTAHEIPFYQRQTRTVLKACGHMDPEDIREYVYYGGYEAAFKAYTEMQPEAICEEILASGLRGRGGGGFPTGKKWQLTLVQPGPKKYVVCNGDEGDPGAFMDRSVMEGNPHSVIEGMMIAARAIGADEGYVYVRTEYPLAVKRIRKAVADAEALGILGDGIFGTDASFRLNVMEGAGAFVCGEETALLASVEGKRGMPMPKPPFPAQKGLFGKPTVINNVETLASVPLIIQQGAGKYRQAGTDNSPGTKTFALTGHVANTGLIEVPFGATLREIVYEIGGGVINDRGELTHQPFKAVQIGGPSGGCLTEEHLDLPLDYDSLREVGAMVGSGGLVVMNQDTCMVQIARFFMQFTQNESCGKCVLCREGTKQMLALLDDIIEGSATPDTITLLETLARVVMKGSLCGLGKTAPSPVLSTLKYFRAEYDAHVIQKRCPAGQCKALAIPEILEDKCIGCTACARKCPVGAITGEKKQLHTIDVDKCVKCGVCAQTCRFDAIVGVS